MKRPHARSASPPSRTASIPAPKPRRRPPLGNKDPQGFNEQYKGFTTPDSDENRSSRQAIHTHESGPVVASGAVKRGSVQRGGVGRGEEKHTASSGKQAKFYGRVVMGLSLHTAIVAKTLQEYAASLPRPARKRLSKAAHTITSCSREVLATSSRDDREGTKFHCGQRGCLRCRRMRSEAAFARLNVLLADLPQRANGGAVDELRLLKARIKKAKASLRRSRGTPTEMRQARHLAALRALRADLRTAADHGWHLVTIDLVYDPRDPAAVTVDALRRRASACRRIEGELWAELWARELGKCLAWVAAIECGYHGLVHLHVLYRGPSRSAKTIAAVAQRLYDGNVDCQVDAVPPGEVQRTLRYVTKPDGIKARRWKKLRAGARTRVPHPELDARWTLANRGKAARTRVVRGLLRGVAP